MRGDGAVTATYNDGAGKKVEVVDPRTGAGLGTYQTSAFFRFVVDLHRSLLMGDAGRIAVAIAALGMLALCVTGAALLARSLGGASALLRPIRGDAARRWHGELGRLALVGLMLSSLTAAFLAATTFGVIPIPETAPPAIAASGGPAAPIRGLAALAEADVADLKQLTFPARGDASGVFRLRTSLGRSAGRSVHRRDADLRADDRDRADRRMGAIPPYRAGRLGSGAGARAHDGGGPGARRDGFRDVAAPPQRKARTARERAGAVGRHDHSRRQRGRLDLGLRPDASCAR